ncbi:hypothetical protein F5X68DRAFT_203810 [Plectosphaerella plurivora]|uniref:Nucleoporin NUP53 n=1 Tax=Plectosphaerella plurivora TaxID=936078 RepID=A0A9P8VFI6_9PEZI|nr:hypothetical protein F5X68DRAFT_203810 [Plectosphaerella plurivora]
MAPLILHNVPDEELYVGDDGIKRPYAMVFPQQETSRTSRRGVTETGSFGKSTRRSRSRTGTPAARRENPNSAAADKLFGEWVTNKAMSASTTTSTTNSVPQRKTSGGNLMSQSQADETTPTAASARLKAEPSEVLLRGYRSPLHQYAAVNHYEHIAGYICEDYPREPPAEQRRYKGDLREPAFTRRRILTAEEKAKVNRADGGEFWVKVTFESVEAAEAAVYASPQSIQGHLVYAEHYRGFAPAQDEPIPDVDNYVQDDHFHRSQSVPGGPAFATTTPLRRRNGSRSSGAFGNQRSLSDFSPPGSFTSSQTLDTASISQTASSGTITDGLPGVLSTPGRPLASPDAGAPTPGREPDSIFCSKIPTAKRAALRPAEEAHLPSQSLTARFLAAVPILMWLMGGFGAMIGNEVPRKEDGEFDHARASLYWKFIWWLDATFGLFRGEIMSADKDD